MFMFSRSQPHIRLSGIGAFFGSLLQTQPGAAASSSRAKSSFIIRYPSPAAPRESPTPLVFVSVGPWDLDSKTGMTSIASMLAEKGYTCFESDIAQPEGELVDSVALIEHFTSTLRSDIQLAAIPFPPVIFARGAGCLVAQNYISSNQAKGLFMIAPPPTNAAVPGLPTPLKEFDYEPTFPIAIMATPSQWDVLKRESRLGNDERVDQLVVPELDGQKALSKAEVWLDMLGI